MFFALWMLLSLFVVSLAVFMEGPSDFAAYAATKGATPIEFWLFWAWAVSGLVVRYMLVIGLAFLLLAKLERILDHKPELDNGVSAT